MHGQETMFTLRFRPPSFSTALHEPSLSPSSERGSTTTLDRRVGNDRDLTILPPNLPTLHLSFSLFFQFHFQRVHVLLPLLHSLPSLRLFRHGAQNQRGKRKARSKGAAFGNRITRFLATRILSSAGGGTGDTRNAKIRYLSRFVRERERKRVTCPNVTLALLFQRQGGENSGRVFYSIVTSYRINSFRGSLSYFGNLVSKSSSRRRDGQSVNDSIFHYH